MQSRDFEPIAIIGMGCRFPGGANSPEAFWDLLCKGTDAIVDVPSDRWDIRRFYDPDPDKPGKTYAKQGGFLREKIDEFDPLFFGISPREAESMDPQQRLLLEVTWEAFEDAGLIAEELEGSRAGVFMGGFCMDNELIRMGGLNRELSDIHTSASSSKTVLSNRISHTFDLRGPSLTIDTACSSSLVATHYATRSMLSDDCDLAIVGGVNVMLCPDFTIAMSKGRFLSEHSRCMAFDERASGYTRGEGAGIVILKRLSDAKRDRNRIYASIRGSGANQDGRTPGISLPNSKAQEALIREVYKRAGVSPGELHFVESHGTGTQAGDTAEISALCKVLSEGRDPKSPCLVGSVKTNIGHLEAVAGVAGLIKAALCLTHGEVPPNLHFERPNPKIPFDKICLRVPTELTEIPCSNGTNYAGVNSFGYGGTNAHVLLQKAPMGFLPQRLPLDRSPSESSTLLENNPPKPRLIPVSARSDRALHDLAGKYAFYLMSETNSISLEDFAYTTIFRRSHHDYRLAVVASSVEELQDKLLDYHAGAESPGVVHGQVQNAAERKLAFVYTGMGPQWWGMGRELLKREPTFRKAFLECNEKFKQLSNWDLLEALGESEEKTRVSETQVAQPANFALQVALTSLYESWGVRPEAVVGHSVGEVTAAYVSGALTLDEAILVSFHRSRLQQTMTGSGAMLAAALTETEALDLIGPAHISIAAVNGPSMITFSGERDALEQVADVLEGRDVFHRFLKVDIAFHSTQMDPIERELLFSLNGLVGKKPRIPVFSTVSGQLSGESDFGADYWWLNVRQPVRFSRALEELIGNGFRSFVEIGPHPVLRQSIIELLAHEGKSGQALSTLRQNSKEVDSILEAVGRLYQLGFPIDWSALKLGQSTFLPLPTYPWQRERFWKETTQSKQDRLGEVGHPFLNSRLRTPNPVWEVELNSQFFPYLNHHQIRHQTIFPGAGYIEAGLAVCRKISDNDQVSVTLSELKFIGMLAIEKDEVRSLSISFDPASKQFSVHSRTGVEHPHWTIHATGKTFSTSARETESNFNLSQIEDHYEIQMDQKTFYKMLSERGFQYGQAFQSVKSLSRNTTEFLLRICSTEVPAASPDDGYFVHPTILDGAFQGMMEMAAGTGPFVPISIERIRYHKGPEARCWCQGSVKLSTDDTLICDAKLIDDEGRLLVDMQSVKCRALASRFGSAEPQDYYEWKWSKSKRKKIRSQKASEKWLIFSSNQGAGDDFATSAESAGLRCGKISHGPGYRKGSDLNYSLNFDNRSDFESLFFDKRDEDYKALVYLSHQLQPSDIDQLTSAEVVGECMRLLNLVQAYDEATIDRPVRLVLISRETQSVIGDETPNIQCHPLWNLCQVIENEHPNINCTLIDLDRTSGENDIEDCISEIVSSDPVGDMAWRSGTCYNRTLTTTSIQANESESTRSVSTKDKAVVLEQASQGSLESFAYREIARRTPGS